MIYWTLLRQNWRVIGVAILLSVIGWQHIRSLNDALEIEGLKNQSRLETVVREQQIREVKNRSDSTLRRINDEHKTMVDAATRNAYANFKRKYPNASRDSLGSGLCSNPAVGLRIPADPGSAGAAGGAQGAHGPAQGIVVTDGGLLERFATDCALDAAAVVAWQRWAQGNQLPVEQ